MTLTPESSANLIQPDFALAYDSAGNVGTITHAVVGGSALATFAYAYDAANRLTHETNAEGSVTYSYDNTNQLTSATGARSESYAYDANGNRNATGYTVGAGGTLSASPNATYTYDAAGHTTAKTDTATGKVTTFSYDYRDRLTGATRKTSGGVVDYQVTYTYDALNRRIGEQIDADGAGSGAPVQTWTIFDGENPYADFTGSGAVAERYLYGPAVDSLLARTDASGVTDWYLADRLGSVRDVVDVSGTVVYHTGYDSFGNNVNASGTGGDRFGFTGREHDAALNLYYNRARFYDPASGRFLSKDPIGFEAGDTNLYRYVGNGPTNGTDPLGLREAVGHHWAPVAALTELLAEGVIDLDAFFYGMGSFSGPTSPPHNGKSINGISPEQYKNAVKDLIVSKKNGPDKIGLKGMEDIIKQIRNGVDCPKIITDYNNGVIKDLKKPLGTIGDSDSIIALGRKQAKDRIPNFKNLDKLGIAFGPMLDSIMAHAEMLGVAADSDKFRQFVMFLSQGNLQGAENALVGKDMALSPATLEGFVGELNARNVDYRAVAGFLKKYEDIRNGG